MIFETHGHYDDEAFDSDRQELLNSFRENDIRYVMNIGANMATSRATVALAEKYDFVYGAVGVHPNDVAELNDQYMAELEAMSKHEKIKAIGEIGLDYHYDQPSKEIQFKWFEAQLELARQTALPVVIHSREAAKDTVDIMRSANAQDIGGVIHCFSYGIDMARMYLDMGFYIGVGGVLTFKNGRKLKEVVEYAPLDRLVLETDSPYLAPEPYRGKRNSALFIPYIAEEIAAIKGTSVENVYEATFNNALKLYKMVD